MGTQAAEVPGAGSRWPQTGHKAVPTAVESTPGLEAHAPRLHPLMDLSPVSTLSPCPIPPGTAGEAQLPVLLISGSCCPPSPQMAQAVMKRPPTPPCALSGKLCPRNSNTWATYRQESLHPVSWGCNQGRVTESHSATSFPVISKGLPSLPPTVDPSLSLLENQPGPASVAQWLSIDP